MSDVNERKAEQGDDDPNTVTVKRGRVILGDLILRAGYGNERIVFTRRGKRIAALVSIADLERLSAA